jgi:putative Holliday junction resolvase
LRTLALDVGERRIGVAISTPEGRLSIPLKTIERRNTAADIDEVRALVDLEGVGQIVVGMPLSMSGERGAQAEQTAAFVETLRAALSIPVDVWDERLSSVEAARRIGEARSKRSRRAANEERGRIDAMAAAIILQSFLDNQHHG